VGGSRHARAAIRPARAWRRFLLQWMPARASSSSSLFGCHREALHARDAPGAGMRPLSRRSHLSRTDDLESRSSIRKIRLWRAPDRQHCRPPKRLRAAWFPWRPVGGLTWLLRHSLSGPPGTEGSWYREHSNPRNLDASPSRGSDIRRSRPSTGRTAWRRLLMPALGSYVRRGSRSHFLWAIRVRDDLMLQTNNSALSICQIRFRENC